MASWLNQQAVDMIGLHPFTGVGIGAFILELGKNAFKVQVSNQRITYILLLAPSWVSSVRCVGGLFISIVLSSLKAQTPESILASAMLAGLAS